MATTFGMSINGSYIRDQMQKVIDKEGLSDVVFHSLRHTSVTYKCYIQAETERWRYQSRPGRFRTCTGGHGNRSIWSYY